MAEEIITGFRLSPRQEHLWLLQQNQESMPYVAQIALSIAGPLDSSLLKKCLLKIVEQHEILRMTFVPWSGMNVPLQTISEARISWADERDLQQLEIQKRESKLQTLLEEARQTAFDLVRGPVFHAQLVHASSQEHFLLLTLPALCADRQTLGILAQRLGRDYDCALSHDEFGDGPIQYADLAQWYHEALESDDAQPGREYWRTQGSSPRDSLVLPFEKRGADSKAFKPRVFTTQISADLVKKIDAVAAEYQVPVSVLLLTWWQIFLFRLTQQSSITIGAAFDGRNYGELVEAIGPLAAHLPVRSRIDPDAHVTAIVESVSNAIDEACKWQDCFTRAEAGRAEADDSETPVFSVCFEFAEQPQRSSAGSTSFSVHSQQACIDRFKVKLSCIRTGPSLFSEFHFDAELFEPESIQCLASEFHTLICSATDNPAGVVQSLEILGAGEREIIAKYNATDETFPHDQCFHNLFEREVERFPNAIAICAGAEQLSYAELNNAANSLAHQLINSGIGPEHRVALYLERSPLMVIAVLAVAKAGAAYLPLDSQAPRNRLRFILNDAAVSAVLTQQQLRDSLPSQTEFPIWSVDTEWPLVSGQSSENPSLRVAPDNLVYVIYTSGSTGTPKGVMISHRSLMNYLTWAVREYRLGAGSRTLVHSPISFDLTVTPLLVPLTVGGTVELVRPGNELEGLSDALNAAENHYSLIKLTPSHLQLLSDGLGERGRGRNVDALIIGGEALLGEMLSVWRSQSKETRLINEYGPTETVVGCSIYEASVAAQVDGPVPIGRPISNMRMYVLDESLRMLPRGVTGEIYIGGEGVGRGYLRQVALTAERFLPDPFSGIAGRRMYRSGDVGRMKANGELEYLGRTDDQVKIRGFRIELGEIESVLRRHVSVKETAVMVQETEGQKRLVGYVVLQEESAEAVEDEIREFLKRELPDYMVPTVFLILERMPLTGNGKVDREALPAPTPIVYDEDADSALLSPAQGILTKLWAEALNIQGVRLTDNFFALGGDSILAVQVAFKARTMGLNLTPLQLFRHPTIARLAVQIEEHDSESAEPNESPESVPLSNELDERATYSSSGFPFTSLNGKKLDRILRKLSKSETGH